MTKPKTLEQLRADKERDRDAACTGTAQVGASGEQKEVSGTGRTGRNFDRNGKDHAAQRGRDAFGSTHDQAPKAAKFAVLNPGHAGFPNRVERSEGSDTTPHLARSESTAHRVKKQQHHQVANRSRSPAGPRRLREHPRPSPKSGKVCRSDTRPGDVGERAERSEGSDTTPIRNATCFAV